MMARRYEVMNDDELTSLELELGKQMLVLETVKTVLGDMATTIHIAREVAKTRRGKRRADALPTV